MSAKSYDDLIQVTELMQERALDKHRRNLAESRRLREELDQIDGLRKAVQDDSESLGARRMSGADTLWQTWLVGERARVLREMAMARARQVESLKRAQTAQARFDAATSMEADEQKRSREKRLATQAETLEALGRMKIAMADIR